VGAEAPPAAKHSFYGLVQNMFGRMHSRVISFFHFRLISRTLYDIEKPGLNSCVLSVEEGAHGKIKRHQKRRQKETHQVTEGKAQRKTGEKKELTGYGPILLLQGQSKTVSLPFSPDPFFIVR